MIVGLCTVELFLPESQSLKDKRQVLLSLKDRLREKFNLSVAEVDGQDLWQKAVLGLACVANEGRYVNQVLDQALNVIRAVPTPVFAKELVTDVERSLGLHFKCLDVSFFQGAWPQHLGSITEVFEQGCRFGDFRRKRLDAVAQRRQKLRVGVAHETG